MLAWGSKYVCIINRLRQPPDDWASIVYDVFIQLYTSYSDVSNQRVYAALLSEKKIYSLEGFTLASIYTMYFQTFVETH